MSERRSIFREEAIRHANDPREEGDVLRVAPPWIDGAYRVVLLALLSALAYGILGTVHEYASGPAVVWITGRNDVTAAVEGTVSAVEVRSGQRVDQGQVLARFYSAGEEAELARIDQELESQLVKWLRDPADQAARQALTSLRTQRDLAVARLEQLSIRAPGPGVVGDVRIRPGQHLAAGDTVVTLTGAQARCSIVAMLPAHYRPQLRPGMSLRFEVTGYRFAYQEAVVESVGTQIIGPREVKRYLGQEIDDTVAVEGPVVLVEAALRSPTFEVDGQTLDLHHGMNGLGEARVRTERIIIALVPALRALFGGNDD
ncbi:MAG: HlyD family efflux transporter periplasmic adaptor subunit [Polyangiaceae bacterium]|nr:HlyD family efflux transporter periplasmic adaptor subunit [Polyangiaceae bacterium]